MAGKGDDYVKGGSGAQLDENRANDGEMCQNSRL